MQITYTVALLRGSSQEFTTAQTFKEHMTHATGEAGGASWIPGSGRSPGGGNVNPLYYCGQENPMGRGDWWATVQGVPKSLA